MTLALTGDYFDIFETQGFHPEPSDAPYVLVAHADVGAQCASPLPSVSV